MIKYIWRNFLAERFSRSVEARVLSGIVSELDKKLAELSDLTGRVDAIEKKLVANGSVPVDRSPRIVNGSLMLLDLKESIQRYMAEGIFEPEESAWVKNLISPGSIFVDVGANFGWFTTLALSLVGNTGRVFAFEPSPVAFATLREAVGYRSNVTLINAAVGQKFGDITLYLPNTRDLHSPSVFRSIGDFSPHQVELVTLDSFEPFSDLTHIDLIKIDVEGSEPDVLEGMKGIIAEGKVRRVICELNSGWLKENNASISSLSEAFLALGFEVEDCTELQTGLPTAGEDTFDLQSLLYRHKSCLK